MTDFDLFANFDRMRREADALLGKAGITRRTTGFSPGVDVAYSSDPPRAIVTAELAGIDVESLDLQIEGRKLVLCGRRSRPAGKGDIYQQIEIERGPFRRVIELAGDVRAEDAHARYEDGMLRVELPLAQRESKLRSVPIEGPAE